MLVAKFGGTSVKDEFAITRLIDIISKKTEKVLIVVSAFSKVTDGLITIIKHLKENDLSSALVMLNTIFDRHIQVSKALNCDNIIFEFLENKRVELEQLIKALNILGEISPKSKDMIMATGELLSSKVIYYAFKSKNPNIEYIDPRKLLITDSNYNEANVNFQLTDERIEKLCKSSFVNYDILITGGFVGADINGNTTTLGRGGSDYSASIFAASLKANNLEIWTDVSGIYTTDPRIMSNAKVIKELTYTEAAELSFFGAKVLHPKTIFPAVSNAIPVWVLNSFHPEQGGTKIVGESAHKKIIKSIAFRKNVTVININSNRMLGAYGFLNKVFEVFGKYETSVDIVTTSEVNISLTIDDTRHLSEIENDLSLIGDINVKHNYALVSAVGEGIRDTAGIAARFFGVLKGINILMVSIGGSEVNLSIIIGENELEQAVRMLHSEFFDNEIDYNIFKEIA